MSTQGSSKLVVVAVLVAVFISGVVLDRLYLSQTGQPHSQQHDTQEQPNHSTPAETRQINVHAVQEALEKLQETFTNAPSQHRAGIAGVIMSRLSGNDLRDLASRIMSNTHLARLGSPETTLEEVLFERLGSELGDDFIPFLNRIPDAERGRRRLAQNAAVNAWLNDNPDGALAYYQRQPLGEIGVVLGGRLAGVWLAKDPESLIAFLKNSPATTDGTAGKDILVRAWASKEPSAAFDWAWGHLIGGAPEPAFVKSAVKAWLQVSPTDAITRLETSSVEGRFSGITMQLFRSFSPEETTILMRELLKRPSGFVDGVILNQGSFAGVDPETLMAFAERLPQNDPRRFPMVEQAIQNIADKNVSKAFEAAGRYYKSAGTDLTQSIIRRWAVKDPEKCMAYILSDLRDQQQATAYAAFASATARQDPVQALQLAEQAPESVRKSIFSDAASSISPQETPRLIAWLREQPESELTARISGTLASSLATRNMKMADEWISTLPAGPSRETAFRSVAVMLTSKDAAAGEKWLQEITNPTDRAAAVPGFVSRITYSNPENALRWALTIPGIQQNPELFDRAAQFWLQQNRDKALEFLGNASVPESLRQRMLPKP